MSSSWFSQAASPQQQQATESAESRMIREMAHDNTLKYGDEIRLFVRSNYLKKPKPAWLSPTDEAAPTSTTDLGWTAEELKGGYIGVYTKPDGTPRVMVPPLGHQAKGSFVESYFRVEPALDGMRENAVGRNVSFGDSVVLIDGDGLVWNNKTGGLFGDGYLQPKPRGTPGEVFVCFAKNGKNAFDPVQFGELGVYIDVVDSHRYRVGFNQRLTNFKGNFSNTAGGYVASDGSGEPLMFVVERYKGRIRNRRGVMDEEHQQQHQQQQQQQQDSAMPQMTSVSVVTFGVSDVQQFHPQYDKPILLYNLQPSSQVAITLDNNMTVVIDGEEMLTTSRHVESGLFEVVWKPAARAAQPFAPPAPPPQFLFPLLKLIAMYVFCYACFMFALTYGSEDDIVLSSRTHKRIRLASIVICWLCGLATPLSVLPQDQAVVAIPKQPPLQLTVTPLQKQQQAAALPPTPKRPTSSVTPASTPKSSSAVDKWTELDEHGLPKHYGFVRFLNGERGNVKVALKRWEITHQWRVQFGVDDMLNRSHKLFFLIKKYYPTFLYGRTKFGNPIYIEQIGKINTRKIRDAGGKLKDMMYHYVYTSEFMWNVLEPAEYGSSLTILDVSGIGVFDFAGENVEFIRKATAVVQEHYPERGFMVFVINAPRWFTGVWAVVSAWVNPATLKKIRICGTNYQEELFKFVDREALPICYGGTNPTELENSPEEKLFRNVAARALIAHNDVAVGPDGNVISIEELKRMIDPSVDHLAYKSQMQKVSSVDGSLLCDENGRPIVKQF